MKPTTLAVAVGLSAPLLFTVPAFAAQPLSSEKFAETAAMSSMFEIESGRLAEQQARHEDVKDFGEQMVDDHTELTEDLKELVQDENINVTLRSSLDQEHQAKLDNLKNLSGQEFDKAYVPMQVKAHEKAVNMFESYASGGENEQLQEWAEDKVSTLKDHLEEARDLNSEVMQVAEADKADTSKQQARAKDEDAKTKKSNIKYVTRQAPTDWSAEALIGRTVENSEGENLGEINNVIINEKGDVVAVTVGVGGFLGIGEKDVGVPFDSLDFRAEEAVADNASADREAEQQRDAARESRVETEHSDIRIVLNTTKEDLENAPEFAWLDEQETESTRGEQVVR